MVMIDLGDEKKSLGFISVTRVTESLRPRPRLHPDAAAFAQVRGSEIGDTDHARPTPGG